MNDRNKYQIVLAVGLTIGGLGSAAGNEISGPSSSESPYLVRSRPGVVTASVLTVGDAVGFKSDGVTPYRLVGIPDGMGAFDNGDGTFTLVLNHELGATAGVVREHGFTGAFVSKWTISRGSLAVLNGEDLIKHLWVWDPVSASYTAASSGMGRLCSGDLPELTAFYNPATGRGYNGRVYMNGEEIGAEGRAFAHLLNGNSYELPCLGRLSWENSVAHPAVGDRTIVMGLDDSGGGQVYLYSGWKTESSNPIDAAGLSHGTVYGIKVDGLTSENANAPLALAPGTRFTLAELGDVSTKTGAELELASVTAAVTGFARPEDGAWDPNNPRDFYFVTTASFTGYSRLWRLRFDDPADPTRGGTIDLLLKGIEGPKMMDNITISKRGSIFIQEDPGNQDYLARIWRYSIASGLLEEVVRHDANRFLPGMPNFLTRDEESSGIIPMDEILGSGWFLLTVQAHYSTDTELVEGGQILGLHFAPGQER